MSSEQWLLPWCDARQQTEPPWPQTHRCRLIARHAVNHLCVCGKEWPLNAERPCKDGPPVGVHGTIKRPRPQRALEAGA